MPQRKAPMSCYSGSDASQEPPDTEIFDRETTSYESSVSSHQYTNSRTQTPTCIQNSRSFEASPPTSRISNRPNSRYNIVAVLLLLWEDDDLGVVNEVEMLDKVFRDIYLFDVKIWRIPSQNSHRELMMRTLSFVSKNQTEDSLLIVYYGGHAKINSARQSTWMANRSSNSPSLDWSATQTLLETAPADVLVLLDCCFAASAAPKSSRGRGAMEMIVACGYETISPEPGEFSFTNALVEVLEDWGDRSFNAVMLHNQLLLNIKQDKPKRTRLGRTFEMRRTPIYICTSNELERPSIGISRRSRDSQCQHVAIRSAKQFSLGIDYFPDTSTANIRVSSILEENQMLDWGLFEQWLSNCPVMAKYVKFETVFTGLGTQSFSKFYQLLSVEGESNIKVLSCPMDAIEKTGVPTNSEYIQDRPANNTAAGIKDKCKIPIRHKGLKTWADRAQLESPELLKKSRTAIDSHFLEDTTWSEDDFSWDPNDSDERSTENGRQFGDLVDKDTLQQFIDSSLAAFKKALINLLMNEFHQIFGSQYMDLISNCAAGSSSAQSSTGNWGERNNESAPTNPSGRRRAEDGDEGESDAKDGEQPPKKKSKSSMCVPKVRTMEFRYACPYYKHDPRRFSSHGPDRKFEACKRGWTDLGHMKEHLIRAHYEKFKCTRCKALFPPREFARHAEAPSACHPRIEGQGHVESGFSHSFFTFLRIRNRSVTQEDGGRLWMEIYSALFPDDEIPSPYMDGESVQLSMVNDYIPFQSQQGDVGRRIASDVEARFRTQVDAIVETVVQPIARGLLGQAPNTIRDAQEEYHYFQNPSSSNPPQNVPAFTSASQFNDSGYTVGSQWDSRALFGGLSGGNIPQPNFEFQLSHQNAPQWPQGASTVQINAIENTQPNVWPQAPPVYSTYGPTYSTTAPFETPDGASAWSMSQSPIFDRTQLRRMIQGEVNAAVQQELSARQNLQSDQLLLTPNHPPPNITSNDAQNRNMHAALDTTNNRTSNRSTPTSQNPEQHTDTWAAYRSISPARVEASSASRESNVHRRAVSPQQLQITYQDAGVEGDSAFIFGNITARTNSP